EEDLHADEARDKRINDLVRQVALDENLDYFDIQPRYSAELAKGPNMLNYRRYPLAGIPEQYLPLVQPYIIPGKESEVAVLDNRLDAHLGNLKGWYADRHPNLAGYHVIADETAKFLTPLIRKRKHYTAQ